MGNYPDPEVWPPDPYVTEERVDPRDVLDGKELAAYLNAERQGLTGPRPRWRDVR